MGWRVVQLQRQGNRITLFCGLIKLGDIVIHCGHIYVANAASDNVEPDVTQPTDHPWTLISGGGVAPTTLPQPFRMSDLPSGDGDYELNNTSGTYSWVLAGSTAGATDVQSIVVPGGNIHDRGDISWYRCY